MDTLAQKAATFRALHERTGAFVIPNPWDVGTAKLLAHHGFEALATTSMGHAFSTGQPDGTIERPATMAHIAQLVTATGLPVSADLENGFGDDPSTVAETIRLAATTGVVGGSIEDTTGNPEAPIHALAPARERITAAVEAARSLPTDFIVTARAENYLYGKPDLADTITRLQAFQEAGADVLYAPGLTSADDIGAVVRSVDRPVNVLMGLQGARLSVAELSELGVARISVGSALQRAALGVVLEAAREMLGPGTFDFADRAAPPAEVTAALLSG